MPEQVAYQFVNFLFDGKMVSSKNAFALGSNEYQMVKNMRYVEDGIETRRGCSIHNATDVNDGSTTIESILQMVVDRYSLTRTIVQADDQKYYYDDDLPTAGAFTGLTMYPTTENASALKAISCGVGETEIICNGEENWVYHGTQPRPTAIFHYDASATSYISWLDEIYSLKTSDVMIIDALSNGDDYIYLGFWTPFSGAYFALTAVNGAAGAMDVEYYNGGWTDVSGDNDETETGGDTTFGQSGLYEWTLPTDWVPTMVEGGLWYFIRMTPTVEFDAEVEINNIYIQAPMQKLANLWDQNWQPVSGAYHYDQTQDEYKDYLPKVIDGQQATYMFLEDFEGGADNDGIYIGTPYKPLAFRIKVDAEYTNTGNAEFDVIEGWDGGAWDAGTGLNDTTKGGAADIASLSQNGIISFNNGTIAYRRGMLEGEDFPMYWTRLEIDADAVDADVRIWDISYVPDSDDPSGASACMEFKDRLLLIGPKDYPNEVWISAPYNPQGFNGNEFTKMTFGDGRKLTDGVSFFNEALIFKEDSTWLIQGFRRTGAGAFGRLRLDDRVGAFRKTAQLGRIWITEKDAAADDYRNVVFFQHRTGVYFSDGNKPIYISDDVSNYFDENHEDYVGAANIAGIDSWFDWQKNEYHLVFATGLELVYNTWFKKWSDFERSVDLKSGAAVIGSNGEPLTYGGSAIGKVFRLENDTSDKDSSDADAAIDAHVMTKAHWPGELEHEINFRRLILVGEGNNTNGGVITINGAIDGGDITDNSDAQYFTLDDTMDTSDTYDHRGYVKKMFPFSIGDNDIEESLHTLQLKFGCATLDKSIKLVGYGMGVAIQRAHFDE